MELAFFTRPVAGLMQPGMPMPTLARGADFGLGGVHQGGDVGQATRRSRRAWGCGGAGFPSPSGARTRISVLVPPRSMPMR